MNNVRAVVALDTRDLDTATRLAGDVSSHAVKLGLEFFSAHGPGGVEQVARTGVSVFLDLKFHDIPNTVRGALRSVAPLSPFMLTVHAAGGQAMMRAAAEEARTWNHPPLVVGVTTLTSLDRHDLEAAGIEGSVESQALRLSMLARDAGLDGVVSAASEAALLRREHGPDFTLVVPGIRPAGTTAHDQKRAATPEEAARAGADYLVIGRAVTGAANPAQALEQMLRPARNS